MHIEAISDQQVEQQIEGYDVSMTVNVADPEQVCKAVWDIYSKRYGCSGYQTVVEQAFNDLVALYNGDFPGFHACDTQYHNLCHVMDVTLAMTRLIDGYEQIHGEQQPIGPERALVGIILALFHDSGYIRRRKDTKHSHGAEYTKTHVSRGARFLSEYLPSIGLAEWVPLTNELIHYTGYESEIGLDDPVEHLLGCLLGTADLIAQMSDRAYLEKCRDHLYPEFKIGQVPKPIPTHDGSQSEYASAEELLYFTPGFIRSTLENRLQGLFGGVYQYLAQFFDGRNLYMEALERNLHYIEYVLKEDDPALLRRLTPSLEFTQG